MNDIEKQILRIIGEDVDNPDVFSDITQIRDSVNDAIEEISMLRGGYTKDFYIPLREGKTFYRIDYDIGHFLWIQSAWLTGQRWKLEQTDLLKIKAQDPRWMRFRSNPVEYFVVGLDVIGFYPVPSSSVDLVQLKCVSCPGRYDDDNDRIFVKENFQRALVHYAVSEYWASRGDANEATIHLEKYADVLGLRVNDLEYQDYSPRLGNIEPSIQLSDKSLN